MRILVSNDDGIDAPGLRELVKVLGKEHEVYVFAPNREKSSFSRSVTYWRLDNKAYAREVEGAGQAWAIDGTPADCVYYGMTTFMEEKPDLVITGINRGENLSTDCLYSGTVGAAAEGVIMGVPAIAVSYCGRDDADYTTSAEITLALLPYVMKEESREGLLLNVNVPALPKEKICGIRMTSFEGRKDYVKHIVCQKQDDGSILLHCPKQEGGLKDERGTLDADITAVNNGYVSVTPLSLDMVDYHQLGMMERWNQIELFH